MIYIVCFIFSTFFAYLASRSKDKGVIILCSAISVLILCVLGGLRATSVGKDTLGYGFSMFARAMASENFFTFVEKIGSYEVGFMFLCYASTKIFENINGCMFVYQLFTIPFIYIGAYKHKDKVSLPFLWLIWCLMYYGSTISAMRQSVAIAIVFMELDKLEKGEYLKFSLAIAVAFIFHQSALMLIAFALAAHMVTTSEIIHKNVWLKIIVVYGSMVILLLSKAIILSLTSSVDVISKYYGYTNEFITSSTVAFRLAPILLLLGEALMIMFYGLRARQLLSFHMERGAEFYIYNILFCLLYEVGIRIMANRVLMYPETINTIVLAALPRFVREKHLRIMVAAVVISVVAYHWYYFEVIVDGYGIFPYRSIL